MISHYAIGIDPTVELSSADIKMKKFLSLQNFSIMIVYAVNAAAF